MISFTSQTPLSGIMTNNSQLYIEVNVTGDDLTSIEYNLYNSSYFLINQTNITITTQGKYNISYTLIKEGLYYYNITLYNSSSSTTTELRNITYDISSPMITLITPDNNTIINTTNTTISLEFNYSVNENFGLDNCSFYMDDSFIQTLSLDSFIISGIEEGNHSWYIKCCDMASNCNSSSIYYFVINKITNSPPFFSSLPTQQNAIINRYYYENVVAIDPDDDTLKYNISNSNCITYGDLSIDNNGFITFHPNKTGSCYIDINVTDLDYSISYSYYVYIENDSQDNNDPVITTTITESLARIGQEYQLQIEAYDPDNDPIFFSLLSAPDGMSISTSDGTVSFTPIAGQEGSYIINISVSDGLAIVYYDYNLTVTNITGNLNITFSSNPITTAKLNETYEYNLDAIDYNGNEVKYYELIIYPEGMMIDQQTGQITWTPTEKGDYNVSVLARDNYEQEAIQSFTIEVYSSLFSIRGLTITSKGEDYEVYPGEEINVIVKIKNYLNKSLEADLNIWLAKEKTLDSEVIVDDEGYELEDYSSFEIEEFENEDVLNRNDYIFEFSTPYYVNDGDEIYVIVTIEGKDENNKTYYDYHISDLIEVKREKYYISIEKFDITNNRIECKYINGDIFYDPLDVEIQLRNIGEEDVNVDFLFNSDMFKEKFIIRNQEMSHDYNDNNNVITGNYKLFIKDNIVPERYGVYLEVYYENNKNIMTRFVDIVCDKEQSNYNRNNSNTGESEEESLNETKSTITQKDLFTYLMEKTLNDSKILNKTLFNNRYYLNTTKMLWVVISLASLATIIVILYTVLKKY